MLRCFILASHNFSLNRLYSLRKAREYNLVHFLGKVPDKNMLPILTILLFLVVDWIL